MGTMFPPTPSRSSPRPSIADFTLVLASPDQLEQHYKAAHVPWGHGKEYNVGPLSFVLYGHSSSDRSDS